MYADEHSGRIYFHNFFKYSKSADDIDMATRPLIYSTKADVVDIEKCGCIAGQYEWTDKFNGLMIMTIERNILEKELRLIKWYIKK